ncbi:TetR/AcrR family transcriptional regulator [Shouchella sp. JSM 1781072]|uniref:TetR/AcrR family transcriptional regulator n=1 Tax=Bacillaceae TaxID=186817 RepID=UPI0020D039BD|nr:TetR/AcrR family transcriptional regulator [Alkalihalobacillus sp. LMS6]UTR05942.1 TetR/AcrR family transcriptional regulator [Alkalihalobacillus sp. LMS6]
MPLSEAQRENMKKKRTLILDVATELFATLGYEGTTIKKVSESAEISFGSVFTYFKDKEALFYAVVVEPIEAFKNDVLSFNAESEEPLSELKTMIDRHLTIYANLQNYLMIVVQIIGQHNKYPEAFAELDAFHDQFREKVKRLVENGQNKQVLIDQDTMTVATMYTSLLTGIRINSVDSRYSAFWESFNKTTMQLFGPINQ